MQVTIYEKPDFNVVCILLLSNFLNEVIQDLLVLHKMKNRK